MVMQTVQIEIILTVCPHALSICSYTGPNPEKLLTLSTLSKRIYFSWTCEGVDLAATLRCRLLFTRSALAYIARAWLGAKGSLTRQVWRVFRRDPGVDVSTSLMAGEGRKRGS